MRTRTMALALGLVLGAGRVTAQSRAAPEGTVLFVCEHGTVKSLLAKLLFEQYAAAVGLPMRAESRGTAADSMVPLWMRTSLERAGLPPGDFRPMPLAPKDLASATLVVSFDIPTDALGRTRAPQLRWDSLPPASQAFAASRDSMDDRVRRLVDSLSKARRRRP